MSRKTGIWPKCECCGELATVAVQDLKEGPPKRGKDREGIVRNWQTWGKDGDLHWFCVTHKRPPRQQQLTNQERARFMAINEGLVPAG